MKVRDWITRYQNGEFEEKTLEIQIEAGWYDWFCNDEELLKPIDKKETIYISIKIYKRVPQLNKKCETFLFSGWVNFVQLEKLFV